MKSKLSLVFGLLVIAAMAITACAPAAPAAEPTGELKVVNLINGVLGDKSFFDSAERGVKKASEEFDIEYKTIEAGIDPAKWQAALEDAAATLGISRATAYRHWAYARAWLRTDLADR